MSDVLGVIAAWCKIDAGASSRGELAPDIVAAVETAFQLLHLLATATKAVESGHVAESPPAYW